jgi:hypothetical protein
MHEKGANFLRQQAARCIALSRMTFDLTVAGQLRALAEEFHSKAAEWENGVPEGSNARAPADECERLAGPSQGGARRFTA